MPAPQANGPAPSQFIVFDDFSGGMDTQSARQGLPEKKAAWLENLQPIAPNNLLGVPGPAATLATLPAGEVIVSSFPAAIGATDYLIHFCLSGSAYAVTVIGAGNGVAAGGGVVTIFAPIGTFSASGGDCTVWTKTRLLIADSKAGYCTWDGTTATGFVQQGGVSPNFVVTAGGTGYTSPVVAITGGSGTGATATAQITAGVVTGITLTNPGRNYLASDTLTVTITDGGAGAGATANGHVWPFLTPLPSTLAVAFGRVWLGAGTTLIVTGTGGATFGASFDDFRVSAASVTTVLTDTDLIHQITALRFINNYLYIVGDNSVKSIGSISVVSSVTSFTITTLSSDQGTIYPLTIVSYDRLVVFANTVGVFAVFGTSVQKISDAMDGIFRSIDFTQTPKAAINDINNIHTLLLLIRYKDPAGSRSLLLAFSNKRWFVCAQGNGLISLATSVLGGITETFGSSGTDVTQLLQNLNTPVAYKVQTSLSPHGSAVRDKRVLRAGVGQRITGRSDLKLTVDSEYAANDVGLLPQTAVLTFINNSGQTLTFSNNSGQVLQFAGTAFVLSHSAAAGVTGRFIGATVTGTLNGIAINGIYLEVQEGALWGKG